MPPALPGDIYLCNQRDAGTGPSLKSRLAAGARYCGVSPPMTTLCYFCGNSATTVEHVPPRAIFPRVKDTPDNKDYRKNLITVPSCEVHNTEKSKEDEYLLYVVVMSLPSNAIAQQQFLTKIQRAFLRRPTLINRILTETESVVVHDTVADTWHNTIAFKPEEGRLLSVFTHIAKGVYFHEHNLPWLGEVRIISEFILSFNDTTRNDRMAAASGMLNSYLGNEKVVGSNPDVFAYRSKSAMGHWVLRMYFYGNTKVTAIF
jgi:hypothetical protein